MPDELEKINDIFRLHEEIERTAAQKKIEESALHAAVGKTGVQNAAGKTSKTAAVEQDEYYDEDELTERDYRPVRRGREYRSGCLGGVMYFVFIICVSIILACVAWMSAADALALNKDLFTAEVTLPANIFTTKTVETMDEDGTVTGTKRVSSADIDYVADELKSAGLIQYKWLFKLFCKVSHADTKLDPGEYELKSSYDYRALIGKMQKDSGAAATVTVTIPEGFTMSQIFYRLEENGVCSYDDLMVAAAEENYDYSFLRNAEAGDALRLEGFLFPDTYEFYVGMQGSSAINKLLDNFHRRVTDEMYERATELGMNMYDVLKVASLIEKEAGSDEERPLIASVIYNRLNAGIVLGIDASVLYPYNDHEGAPTMEMLEKDDPYNTRIHDGLPPTPICSPGLASIYAALYPESTNYYFYALDADAGVHRFFINDTEFNNFVASQNYA